MKCTCVSEATEAPIVINQLYAVEAADGIARPRQTFVEIALTVVSNKPGRTGARVTTHAVDALPSISTPWLRGAGAGGAVVLVHLALNSYRAANTRTCIR